MRKFYTHPQLMNQAPGGEQAPKKTNVINYEADHSGCGHWRMFWPSQVLNARNDLRMCHPGMALVDERSYMDCAAVRLQRQVTPNQLEFVKHLKNLSRKFGFKLIYEIDDVMFREGIPLYNAFRTAFEPDEIRKASQDIMMLCDEITVTGKGLRDYYKAKTGHPAVTIVPNFPPRWWIGNFYNKGEVHARYDKYKKKPRVLYPGAGAHFDVTNRAKGQDDFSHINKFVIDTRHKYQWVFFGGAPAELIPYIQKGEMELHTWVNILDFPKKIHSLECQAIIAPLQDNDFNRGKSDIKLIEGAAFGLPVICQDMITYEDAEYKFTTAEDLGNQLELALKDAKTYKAGTERWRQMAESRFMENVENIGCWTEVLTTPHGSPDRKFLRKWN